MATKKHHIVNLMILVIFSVIYMLPLIRTGGINYYTDQDTAFHLSRINGLSNVFSSPVNFDNFGGNGTAMNVFYPWLTLYPAYLLLKITGSMIWSYNLYYLFYTFLTMLFAYMCMYQIKKDYNKSIIFSVIYTFATYRSTDIFFRGSLGEAIALTFLPLVLLGCYYIFYSDYKKWYWLSIGMTLTVYTHLLSVALNAFFILVGFLICLLRSDQRIERVQAFVKATLTTLLLSASFLLPMIEQSAFVELKVPQPRVPYGLQLPNYITNILANNFSYFGIGFVLFLLVLYGLHRRQLLSNFDSFMFYLGLITVFISSDLFPWYLFIDTPVAAIQFPWRLTAYATLFLSFAVTNSFVDLDDEIKNNIVKTILLFLVVLSVHAVSSENLFSQDGRELYNEEKAVRVSKAYYHTDYANQDSMNYPELVRGKQFILNNSTQQLEFDFTDSDFSFQVAVNEPTEVITPLYFYKGQVVEVNGVEVPSSLSPFGTTMLYLQEGKANIKIYYEYTLLARLSQLISVVTALVFSCYIGVFIKNEMKENYNKPSVENALTSLR